MNRPARFTRRDVLRTAAGAGATYAALAGLPSWFVDEVMAQDAPKEPKSANDLPAVALIGGGGRGRAAPRDRPVEVG
jgi:hypothetical protein